MQDHPVDHGAQTSSPTEASLALLLRRLAEQGQALVRQEVALAKAELRESVRDVTTAAGVMAAGAVMILIGLTVFLVFLILALGALLGDRYWLSSLLVGLLFGVIGVFLVTRGKGRLAGDRLVPEKTLESVQETAQWASAEAQRLKRDGS